MVRRARHHIRDGRLRDSSRLLVVALIAIVTSSPVATLMHELTVRHVRCAEHDELTHVRASQGVGAEPAQNVTSMNGEGLLEGSRHEHCLEGALLRRQLHSSIVRPLVRPAPPRKTSLQLREVARCPARSFVLASAPKTSPPVI